jgi:hypothetical protein
MSKSNSGKKRVVVSTASDTPKPTVSRTKNTTPNPANEHVLIFKRMNYILMGAGAVLVLLGMLLMAGGSMPSPDVWDEDIIYSTRRTVIAPIVILAGIGVEVYAIFRKS